MASPADQTIVKYIILETDDYKEPEHPNFFRSSKPAHQMKLHDIKERFIDWKGSFHFYFKTKIKPSSADDEWMWEDIDADDSYVPLFNGEIFAKAVRTGFKQFFEVKSKDKDVSASIASIASPGNAASPVLSRNASLPTSPTAASSPTASPLVMRKRFSIAGIQTSPLQSPRGTSKIDISMEEEAMLEDLGKSTHFSIVELKAMYTKFKRETPNMLIDKEGFVKVTKGMGIQDEFLQDLIFNKFDRDKSGSVDFIEFISGLSVLTRGTPDEKLRSAFEMYDIDGNGSISKEEFKKILSSFIVFRGGTITTFTGKTYNNIDDICDEFFNAIEKVTLAEFQAGASKNPDIMRGLSIV
ncbi:calcium-binding protein [Planoprotostelium fungivorum]|uniref:Calcium-binding protein n=1 Tax=Planoprotostelium fungivorum TaxID=1890364 RepID=A0A2P6N7T3_9EUKA|nr:calcium-binding protein [Planoprotostelium fungivorum]